MSGASRSPEGGAPSFGDDVAPRDRRAIHPAGRFITFEGIDGAGKSTHLGRCAQWLRNHGIAVVVTREPGGTELGEAIRGWFLHQPTDAQTEALLAFAARSDHLNRLVRPALDAGEWVLCDRFTDSTVAYQGAGRGLGAHRVEQLEQWLHPDLQPDRTYLFDLDPAQAAMRRSKARAADRFEAEDIAFFTRVRGGYQARMAAEAAASGGGGRAPGLHCRMVVIDAAGDPEAIWRQLEEDLAMCHQLWEGEHR
jgi:dTMP kinase